MALKLKPTNQLYNTLDYLMSSQSEFDWVVLYKEYWISNK